MRSSGTRCPVRIVAVGSVIRVGAWLDCESSWRPDKGVTGGMVGLAISMDRDYAGVGYAVPSPHSQGGGGACGGRVAGLGGGVAVRKRGGRGGGGGGGFGGGGLWGGGGGGGAVGG